MNEQLVEVRDGQVVVNSRQVAEKFGKEHKNVLQSIEEIISVTGDAEKSASLFMKTNYIHPQNKQQYKEYIMNRDGFSLLVMSFNNTKKVLEWKLKYIAAFNEMEEQLLSKPAFVLPDFTNPIIAARAWADECEAKQIAQAKVVELLPKANYYDVILQSKKAMPIKQIAKDYGMTAQEFNKLLSRLSVQYKEGGVWYLYAKYDGNGYTQSRTYTPDDEYGTISYHTYWTQKGRKFLYNLLKEHGILPCIEKVSA